MTSPKNNKVPNDSKNNNRYSINNIQLIEFCKNKEKDKCNSLNNSININNNDIKNNLRNDFKLINVNFNNEMIINKKRKSLTPKNEGNMKFLKDKLIPDSERIKVKERCVKKYTKCIKYLNLKDFNKLIIKKNINDKKIINQAQNLNINIKNLVIDISQLPEKKKNLIQYKENRTINDMNSKPRKKCFINKDLSIDSLNLNIQGRNDNLPKNNSNTSKNLNEKKILNNFESEHKFRQNSPTLITPDYSKNYINNADKMNGKGQKRNLNNNRRANILSRSQDNFKKTGAIQTPKPKVDNNLLINKNIPEGKYNDKSSKNSMCLPQ